MSMLIGFVCISLEEAVYFPRKTEFSLRLVVLFKLNGFFFAWLTKTSV